MSSSSESVRHEKTTWPEGSQFFDPLTMDAERTRQLLDLDTLYKDWHMAYTTVHNGTVKEYVTTAQDRHKLDLWDEATQPRLTVIHIRQMRVYIERHTASSISLDAYTWRRLLAHLDILPTFLPLLHSNNGGVMLHVSRGHPDGQAFAFHVGYKMGHWGHDEVAIYGRHDLGTGRQLVVVLGTEQYHGVARITRLLKARPEAHFLHVIQALLSGAYHAVETARWKSDHDTQMLESLTGIAIRQPAQNSALNLHTLRFNKGLQLAADYCRTVLWGSSRIRGLFEAFQKHLDTYAAVCWDPRVTGMSPQQLQALHEACAYEISLVKNQYDQTAQLQARLQAQIDITRTLMAQRDIQTNLEIASATRRDSELMRGIAAVTMVFLPATFVATFFSMSFFHVGNEERTRLIVDRRVWLYPLVTIPLTVGMTAWYYAWSSGWSSRRRARRLNHEKPAGNSSKP